MHISRPKKLQIHWPHLTSLHIPDPQLPSSSLFPFSSPPFSSPLFLRNNLFIKDPLRPPLLSTPNVSPLHPDFKDASSSSSPPPPDLSPNPYVGFCIRPTILRRSIWSAKITHSQIPPPHVPRKEREQRRKRKHTSSSQRPSHPPLRSCPLPPTPSSQPLKRACRPN